MGRTTSAPKSFVDFVDKDQYSCSGIWVFTALVPWMKMKTQRVKIKDIIFNVGPQVIPFESRHVFTLGYKLSVLMSHFELKTGP